MPLWCLIPKGVRVSEIRKVGVRLFYETRIYKKMTFESKEDAEEYKKDNSVKDYKVKKYYGNKKPQKTEVEDLEEVKICDWTGVFLLQLAKKTKSKLFFYILIDNFGYNMINPKYLEQIRTSKNFQGRPRFCYITIDNFNSIKNKAAENNYYDKLGNISKNYNESSFLELNLKGQTNSDAEHLSNLRGQKIFFVRENHLFYGNMLVTNAVPKGQIRPILDYKDYFDKYQHFSQGIVNKRIEFLKKSDFLENLKFPILINTLFFYLPDIKAERLRASGLTVEKATKGESKVIIPIKEFSLDRNSYDFLNKKIINKLLHLNVNIYIGNKKDKSSFNVEEPKLRRDIELFFKGQEKK